MPERVIVAASVGDKRIQISISVHVAQGHIAAQIVAIEYPAVLEYARAVVEVNRVGLVGIGYESVQGTIAVQIA
jgi:hypothetical protein